MLCLNLVRKGGRKGGAIGRWRLWSMWGLCVAIVIVGTLFYIKYNDISINIYDYIYEDDILLSYTKFGHDTSPLAQWVIRQTAEDENDAKLFLDMAKRVGVVVASGPENYYANRELAIRHSWGWQQQGSGSTKIPERGQFARLQYLLFERDWKGNWYKQVATAREWAKSQTQEDDQESIEWLLFVLPDVFVNVANLFRFIHEIELNDSDARQSGLPRVYGRTVETTEMVGPNQVDHPVNLTSLVGGILMNMAAVRVIVSDHPKAVNKVPLFASIYNDDIRLGYFLSLLDLQITSSPLFGVTSPLCKDAQEVKVSATENTTVATMQQWVHGITISSTDMWNMVALAGRQPLSRLACRVKLFPVTTSNLLFATIVGPKTLPLFRAGLLNMTLEHNLRLVVATNMPKEDFSQTEYPNIDWYIDSVEGDSWNTAQRHFGHLIHRAYSYVYDHTDIKWVVYGDTDTAFNLPALMERLSQYDPYQPVLIGEYNDGRYPHGGAGMIMSVVALHKLKVCIFVNSLDITLGNCARATKVNFVHDGGFHWIPISHFSGYGRVPPDLAQLPPLSEHRLTLEDSSASSALFKQKNAAYSECSRWQSVHFNQLKNC